jgi:hypothetical protein
LELLDEVEVASAVVPDTVLSLEVESEVEAAVVSEVVPDAELDVVPVLEADDPLEFPSKLWSTL